MFKQKFIAWIIKGWAVSLFNWIWGVSLVCGFSFFIVREEVDAHSFYFLPFLFIFLIFVTLSIVSEDKRSKIVSPADDNELLFLLRQGTIMRLSEKMFRQKDDKFFSLFLQPPDHVYRFNCPEITFPYFEGKIRGTINLTLEVLSEFRPVEMKRFFEKGFRCANLGEQAFTTLMAANPGLFNRVMKLSLRTTEIKTLELETLAKPFPNVNITRAWLEFDESED